MNFDLLNMIIMLTGVTVGLWETILLARGRRVLKGTNEILAIANIGAAANIINQAIDNVQYLILGIIGLIIIYGLIRYFSGVEYRIHSQNQKLLSELVNTALREIENLKPEKVEEEKKVTFSTPDSKKTIELKEKETMWSGKKIFHINFKRWLNFESRKEIVSLIENTLQEEEEHEHSKIKIALQGLALAVLIGAMVFFTSNMVMEPRNLRTVVPDELPKELYLIKSDRFYRDEDVLKELHESLKGSFAYRNKEITQESLLKSSEVTLNYASNYRILYLERNNVYLYIDDAETGSKSLFHRVCWEIHRLYDKKSGTFYRVHADRKTINKLLDHIIESN